MKDRKHYRKHESTSSVVRVPTPIEFVETNEKELEDIKENHLDTNSEYEELDYEESEENDFEGKEYDDENENSDTFISKIISFWESINKHVLAIFIFVFTIICTLCFPIPFFKVLSILEAIAIGIYFLYTTYEPQENPETEEFYFDKTEDGFELVLTEEGISLSELIIQDPVEELKDLLEYLKNPDDFASEGYKPESKILMIGETGSGKETLIKAFAHDAELPIIRVHASRFFDVEKIFESLFALAPYTKAYILQIDSFDILLSSGSTGSAGIPLSDIIIDKLSAYLSTYQNVILFATCEDASTIALSQSAQKFFKKVIVLDAPDFKERINLLKEFTSKFTLDETVDFNALSKNCIGLYIGDIKYLVSTAVSIAHKNGRKTLAQNDFFDASDSLQYGISSKKHSKESQKIVAYHESGHALAQYILSGKKSLIRVVSTTRGGAGGVTFTSIDEEKVVMTQKELINEICVLYAGRCAEKLVFDHFSTGASSDISKATSMISSMVQQYGMSDAIGPINVAPKVALMAVLPESSEMRNLISKECIRIARECEEKTMNLLIEHKEELVILAQYLIEHETITGEEMEELLNNSKTDNVEK